MQVVCIVEEVLRHLGFDSHEESRLNFSLHSHKMALTCVLANVYAVYHIGSPNRLYRNCQPSCHKTAGNDLFFDHEAGKEISTQQYFEER